MKFNIIRIFLAFLMIASFQMIAFSQNETKDAVLEVSTFIIDDDQDGGSNGDADGIPEGGETIEMPLSIINSGSTTAHNVSAILSCDDPYINITDDSEGFGIIENGEIKWSANDFDFKVLIGCPEKDVEFSLEISSNEGSWTDSFIVHIMPGPVPDLAYHSQLIDDDDAGSSSGNGNGIAENGESIGFKISIYNSGQAMANNVSAILSCSDEDIVITDNAESYGDIDVETEAWCNYSYDFDISLSCPTKEVEFILEITAEEGSWTSSIMVSVVNQGYPNLEYVTHIINDDESGTSNGNGDGIPNSGESIQMPVQITNTGEIDAHNISSVLSCDDPDITITDANEGYDDLVVGESVWTNYDYDFDISETCPTKEVEFILILTSDEGSWEQTITVLIEELGTPELTFNSFIIDDDEEGQSNGDSDGIAEPGEQIELNVLINNIGNGPANNVGGTISTDDVFIEILDDHENFGDMEAGEEAWSVNDFDFKIADDCPEKDVVFTFDLDSDEGNWSTTFTIHISNLAYYNIESYASPEIGGATQGDGEYANNETATMLAIPAEGYKFIHWMENDQEVSTDEEYVFDVDQDRLLMAVFEIIEGINLLQADQYKLYPNPCSNMVSLELETKSAIYITNANGVLVKQINDFKTKHVIDLSDQAKGLYFIKIISDEEISVLKLIKE